MKGLELPINMIIVIAIAVLVLVVISAFFASQTGSGIGTIQLEDAFSRGCITWKNTYNCDTNQISWTITGYNYPGTTRPASFSEVCTLKGLSATAAYDTTNSCQKSCGCPRPS